MLGGITSENIVTGGGWAGNLKQAGFKGEGTYFYPIEGARDTSGEALVATISLDYSFKNSLYVAASMLYSSNGTKSPTPLEQLAFYSGAISAKFLSPYTWTGFINMTYQFHPLVNGGFALIGYPGSSDGFVNPFATISVLQSLDLDLIAQLLVNKVQNEYGISSQFYYFRIKYSF